MLSRRSQREMAKVKVHYCGETGCYDPGLIVIRVSRYDNDDHIHHDSDVLRCPRHAVPILEALGSPTRPCPARTSSGPY